MGVISTLVGLAVLAFVIVFLYYIMIGLPNSPFGNISIPALGGGGTTSLNYPNVTTSISNYVPNNQTIAYALSLINHDRNKYGLANVSISNETSAQQHSDSMLQNHYFSHWDVYGMKPYMRYTLLGGRQQVTENIAYIYNSSGINVLKSLKTMEYNMMYNDLQCCNNGHRDNILDPTHNQVSIGVSYNSTTIYFAEDFIDNYTTWFYGTPSYSNGDVALKGQFLAPYNLSEVEISYDTQVQNMTVAQLDNTSSYGYGSTVAGIGYWNNNRYYSFPSLTTINASTYTVQGHKFDVNFNMSSLISQNGAGEYSVLVFVTDSAPGQPASCSTNSQGIKYCNGFLAASYTIFINASGKQYTPQYV